MADITLNGMDISKYFKQGLLSPNHILLKTQAIRINREWPCHEETEGLGWWSVRKVWSGEPLGVPEILSEC